MTTMFQDSQGFIELAKNPSHHSRMKHINIKFHHVRDAVATKKIHLQYCPTQEMIANLQRKDSRGQNLRNFMQNLV